MIRKSAVEFVIMKT